MGRTPLALLLLAGLLAAGCDSPRVEPLASKVQGLDDRITVRGTFCTRAAQPTDFPVKVVFVIDKSGSMCITDPPGAQANPQSLCQNFAASITPGSHPDNFCEPDGNAHPGRTCAMYQLLEQFADKPNVEVALVPFETKISGSYPSSGFAPVIKNGGTSNIDTWVQRINDMQGSLGQGTDYQGAFAEAYTRIATDIVAAPKASRPRTRYVVVFLTDGTPFPRCAANDSLPPQDYASPSQPDLIWPDSPGAGCPGLDCFCNTDQVTIDKTGIGGGLFTTGTDRNQNYQILDTIDRIMELRKKYDVADIRVHSILLWNTGNIATLNASQQQDLFGDVGTSNPVQAAHDVAEHLLRKISEGHGNGTYQEFRTVAQIQLGALDYTSLAAPFTLKNIIVSNTSAVPRPGGQVVDSDGDGLPDDLDNEFTAGTSVFDPSSHHDGFLDSFEYEHAAQGFDTKNGGPDPRGCRDSLNPPHRATCGCQDTDGDGLSACAEAYLGTDSTLMDSDGDGVPDGLEAMYGMDPTQPDDKLKDSDGDGVPDVDEIRAHTDPRVADRELAAKEGYHYALQEHDEDGGVRCYDYAVSNVRMLTPQAADGTQHGYNTLRLYFDQAPESNVAGDYGEWSMACATVQYAPPSVRAPQGSDLVIDKQYLQPADNFDPQRCVEAVP
jgi:hypothetical protein